MIITRSTKIMMCVCVYLWFTYLYATACGILSYEKYILLHNLLSSRRGRCVCIKTFPEWESYTSERRFFSVLFYDGRFEIEPPKYIHHHIYAPHIKLLPWATACAE